MKVCALAMVIALAVPAVSSANVAHVAERRRAPIFVENFNHQLGPEWLVVQDGRYVRPRNARVHNGMLNLWCRPTPAGAWKGAIVILKGVPQKYGRFVIRVRTRRATWTRNVALLWPSNDRYPPEVDFLEVGQHEKDRQRNTLSVHYGTRRHRHILHRSYAADMTRWHRVGVSVRQGFITFRLDGKVMPNWWGNLRTRVPNPGVDERQKLNLKIVPSAHEGRPTPWPNRRSRLQIDWVKVWD